MRTLIGKRSGVKATISIPLGPVPIDNHNDCVAVSTDDNWGRFIVGERAEITGDEFGYNRTYRVVSASRGPKCSFWTIILEELGHGTA